MSSPRRIVFSGAYRLKYSSAGQPKCSNTFIALAVVDSRLDPLSGFEADGAEFRIAPRQREPLGDPENPQDS